MLGIFISRQHDLSKDRGIDFENSIVMERCIQEVDVENMFSLQRDLSKDRGIGCENSIVMERCRLNIEELV